jgi:hypothetical protein
LDLLDLFGKGYVVDHCIAFFQKQKRQEELEYYITDTLMYIAQNTANISGGKVPKNRFYEIMNRKPEETRTAQDIINNIKRKLGG